MHLPTTLDSEAALDDLLTRPSPPLVEFIRTVRSPLVILGAGGKMGPTLAVLARRAADAARHTLDIVAVSRFTDVAARDWLEARGVRTLACDLLDRAAIARLPDTANLVSLVGLKFGTSTNPSATWAVNTLATAHLCERYAASRIVALSTGNVYPPSDVTQGGSREEAPLTPVGEYANAAVARERLYEYFSGRSGTPVAILRLFYAVELRYGVLVDIARQVLAETPIPLATGFFNCIWQGDANELILRALPLADSPPSVWNLCRPETFSVREVAHRLGRHLGREPRFNGAEAPVALLGISARLVERLGPPATAPEAMLAWIAAWVAAGGRNLGKPTHFEVRDGRY